MYHINIFMSMIRKNTLIYECDLNKNIKIKYSCVS